MTVLVLGGTGEGRALAEILHAAGVPVISSLAGRVAEPRRPRGDVRVGGFGGAEGLARWLEQHRPAAVVDATHPFAATMAAGAASACGAVGVPLLRLERPAWTERPHDRWHRVADVTAAAAVVGALGRRVLLTLGRQELAPFAGLDGWFLIRSIDPPQPPLPGAHEVVVERGPFTLSRELALLDRHRIDVVVTRDSGGGSTAPKLDAARERRLPVVMVDRPPRPDVATVHEVSEAARWVHERLASLGP